MDDDITDKRETKKPKVYVLKRPMEPPSEPLEGNALERRGLKVDRRKTHRSFKPLAAAVKGRVISKNRQRQFPEIVQKLRKRVAEGRPLPPFPALSEPVFRRFFRLQPGPRKKS